MTRGRKREATVEGFLRAKSLGMPYAGAAGSEKTLASYKDALKRAERLVGKPLGEFGQEEVEALVEALGKFSDSTKSLTITAVRVAFDWAIGNGLHRGPNPTAGTTVANNRRNRLPKAVDFEAIERFLAVFEEISQERRDEILRGENPLPKSAPWLGQDTGRKYRLFFSLSAYGGLRIGEVRNLKKADLQRDGVKIVGKGDKERFVPLPQWLLDELRSWVESHPYTKYVFYGESGEAFGIDTGRPINTATAYKYFDLAKERTGMPDWFTPHTLRHSFATRALNKTKRIEVVQDLLGHENLNTTRIYARVSVDDLKEEYAKIF